ncbi:hypothetical protein KKD52_14930 [Myxococcota bacterium]|nr:hypothetical protein [Myxococcota bacterium]
MWRGTHSPALFPANPLDSTPKYRIVQVVTTSPRSPVQFAWVLGVATLLNEADAACFERCTVTSAGGTQLPSQEKPHMIPSLPYLGFSVGFTF